jgi:myo-inositol-1(or 4)-monophosphatase
MTQRKRIIDRPRFLNMIQSVGWRYMQKACRRNKSEIAMHQTQPEPAWTDAGTQAVHHAASILQSASTQMRTTRSIEEDGKEKKILADEILHREISSILDKTGLPIYSEEGNHQMADDKHWCWVVDPLDGSANYQRGFSLCAVSIALCKGKQPKTGFIYDLHTDACICAGAGLPSHPALLSAHTPTLDKAILCTGIPARLKWSPENTAMFSDMFRSFFKVRMLGSAVQALLHVATGKADVYFERNTMFWDVSAACAIAASAGIMISSRPGSREGSLELLASPPQLHDACKKLFFP